MVVVVAVLWYSQFSPYSPNSVPNVTTPAEYKKQLERAHSMTAASLEAARQDKPLTPTDISRLELGAKIFMGLSAYAPDAFGPTFAVGQLSFYKAVNETDPKDADADYERARQFLNQAITLYEDHPRPELKVLEADAHYMLSIAAKNRGLTEESVRQAGFAVEGSPGNPDYLWERASASSQLASELIGPRPVSALSAEDKVKVQQLRLDARADLMQALQIDPNHQKSQSLLSFIDHK